ncbi:MAG: GNAT family N-acetyltransferase [Candidatus Gracilibacteria bacterium]|nr:GNAT family N-acetyltransferase [Candidatus Gracilibacteria bacterium]
MKTLSRNLIPEDFSYYRTASKVFRDYYEKYTGLIIGTLGKYNGFFIAFHVLPYFWSITSEKHDEEITREKLRSVGIPHGIVFWTPHRRIEKPKGWWRVPTWFTKWNIHSSRSAFSILDRADYWNKWSSSARAHRRHMLENIGNGTIRIEKNASIRDFLSLYRNTKIHDPNKGFVSRMTEKLFQENIENYRVYIISVNGHPLAGAVFIDEGVTSEYWASFYHDDSRPYHLGIAMMDAWFLDSYEKGIKYCDLDHMRDRGQSFSYAGYTKFKESIADYDVYFHDMWVKIF